MKSLILILLTFVTLSAEAGIERKRIRSYWKESSEKMNSLKDGESLYRFKIHFYVGQERDEDQPTSFMYSIDGVSHLAEVSDSNTLDVKTTAGKHVFQFYYTGFEEIRTDTLLIKGQHMDVYRLNMFEAYQMIEVDKPVIYLYPEKETDVSVQLNINGTATFTYPLLEEAWKFTAHPNGDLQFGTDIYRYLFWEATPNFAPDLYGKLQGFVVEKENVVPFLEKKLTIMGFNSKERADFITYWGPRLQQHSEVYLRFLFNNDCEKYAEMTITPQPDNVFRMYMIWSPLIPRASVSPQPLERMNREGFTVVEWGGQQLNE